MVNYLASYKELLLFEEFWVIAFRAKSDLKDSILHNHDGEFQLFHQNIRFWFADPFLFEYEGATYLFYEMFDRIKRKGVIGYSKFENNVLSKPTVILEDSFHLSFPFVYKKGNDIFMIPECSESNKITLYNEYVAAFVPVVSLKLCH